MTQNNIFFLFVQVEILLGIVEGCFGMLGYVGIAANPILFSVIMIIIVQYGSHCKAFHIYLPVPLSCKIIAVNRYIMAVAESACEPVMGKIS